MTILPLAASAQSFDELWNDFKAAAKKDLPKTQIATLDKIVEKAQKEHNYGQLLAGGLQRASLQIEITPDSATESVKRLAKDAEAEKNQAAKAVYYTILSDIYKSNTSLGDDHYDVAKSYRQKALADVDVLAKTKTKGYTPIIDEEADSRIFGNDLLHVLASHMQRYDVMYNYYKAHGNNDAACLAALWRLDNDDDADVAHLDKLMKEFPTASTIAEVAMKRYGAMPTDNNAQLKAKYDYGNEILERYKSYKSIAKIANDQTTMTQKRLNYTAVRSSAIPNRKTQLEITATNIHSVKVVLTRLNADGYEKISYYDKEAINKLYSKKIKSTERTITKDIHPEHPYDIVSDSITLPGLTPGVWLVEVSSSDIPSEVERSICNITNLKLINQNLPDGSIRLVTVNATTGEPIANAKIRIKNGGFYGKKEQKEIVTNAEGEYLLKDDTDGNRYISAWPYTDDDRGNEEYSLWSSKQNAPDKNVNDITNIFTDRAIYRPGQTVHVAVIAFNEDNKTLSRKALAGKKITLKLLDANYQTVATKDVTTNNYGSAATDFDLPASGLTGRYTVSCDGDDKSISVEEYKRPAFEVTFDDYKEAYAAGDTIVVKGHAKTYTGMPVQNAKVSYTIKRQHVWWWRWWSDNDEEEYYVSGEAVTDEKGDFSISVPLTLPKADREDLANGLDVRRFYTFTTNATVTDQAGESHYGLLDLPLGTHPTVLSAKVENKIERDSVVKFSFNLLNAAGKPVDGNVAWTLSRDGATVKTGTSAANKTVTIGSLPSGGYKLEGICKGDTARADFAVFSISDKKPVIKTDDWFWQSADKFANDGKKVYVQFGSSNADQHYVYTIYAGGKIQKQGAIDMSNGVKTLEFKYDKAYGDGVVVAVAWVRNGNLYAHHAQIERPEPDNHLKLSWKTFRDRLTPGQHETWTLSIGRPDGKPADAELMVTLFDKSLDQIEKHEWLFNPSYSTYLPSIRFDSPYANNSFYGLLAHPMHFSKYQDLSFSSIDKDYYNAMFRDFRFMRGRRYSYKGIKYQEVVVLSNLKPEAAMESKAAASLNKINRKEVAADSVSASEEQAGPAEKPATQIRKNMNETAFFYPQLKTGNDGTVDISFTLPESVTTWQLLGLAHDANINYGKITAEAIASKTVMVQPNMPRFLRQGDKAQISSRIFNTSEKAVSGNARLEIVDPSTEKVLKTLTQPFSVDAGSTASATFNVNPEELVADASSQSLLIVRVTAEGDGFSDGEQHYLAILPNKEYVINTVPFTQTGQGSKTIDLKPVMPKDGSKARVTFEYTNNPTWLMVQALPYVADANEKNAISLAVAYFANSIAKNIIDQNPQINSVFEQWRRESGSETSLQSALEKNDDLRQLVINETPWVLNGKNETEQKHNISRYFDENALSSQLKGIAAHLEKLQNPDGSFSWWSGMKGSLFMTEAVQKMMVRLVKMTGHNATAERFISDAWPFLDSEVADRVAEMKRLEAKKLKVWPSDVLCDYVYTSALAGRKSTADIRYIVDMIAKMPRDLTIYGKANSAVILSMYGKKSIAKEYLQSIMEYSVYKEEMGRYFDSPKAYYSWFDYRIPTQTAVIEALRQLSGNEKTITELQRWLLQEKRTQAWDTPINSSEAIYAFLGGDSATSQRGELSERQPAAVALDGKAISMPKASAGTGYVKEDISTDAATAPEGKLTVDKPSDGTSWGCVYTQFFAPLTDIGNASSGMTVKRQLFVESDGKKAAAKQSGEKKVQLKVGDRVKVRITIRADRDYDFVSVSDRRAACLEPASQLSGYQWGGYYIAPKDQSTNYYFDRLAKGEHVVETDYYVDRAGTYTIGTCTAQCAYAPEFSGRQGGLTIEVK